MSRPADHPPAMRLAEGWAIRGRLACEPIDLAVAPGGLLGALEAVRDPVVLESSARHESFGRYSVFACEPVATVALTDGALRNGDGHVLASTPAEIWRCLQRLLGGLEADLDTSPGGLGPGWLGYFGYEVGRIIERLPGRARRDTCAADLRLALYDAVLVHDNRNGRWDLVRFVPEAGVAGDWGRSARALREWARRVADPHEPPAAPVESSSATVASHVAPPQSNFTPDQYRAAVRRCVDHIAAGDIFQVNLSQRLCVEPAPAPEDLYRALRRRNPAWYAAFLRFETEGGPVGICSCSPELFVQVRGDHVLTRPIKGTRPRVGDADADARAAGELVASPKDRAELAMIVDLLRNDLGRVCRYGSVRVTAPQQLETHPTVFHLVATIEGRLQRSASVVDLLRAALPGGSITGAPKIRAMEIIDDLEDVARGVYTGSIGIASVTGASTWNIAIRTVTCAAGRALVPVGGGIVADSDPEAEWRETLDKARGMLEAIELARGSQASAAQEEARR